MSGPINPNHFRLLVVDDDLALLEELKASLEDEGYGVVTASSGEQAVERLHQGHIDLLLSDIRMPRGDGMYLLKSVRAEDPSIPFIFMTGFRDIQPAEALEMGANALLAKPLDVSLLFENIATELSKAYDRK